MLPNEDDELWTVLKKLLQDAFEHDGQTVCLFEVGRSIFRIFFLENLIFLVNLKDNFKTFPSRLIKINMQLTRSKLQIVAKLAPCPTETEKSKWFDPAKFPS